MFRFAHVSGNLRQTERLFFMVESFICFFFFDFLFVIFVSLVYFFIERFVFAGIAFPSSDGVAS